MFYRSLFSYELLETPLIHSIKTKLLSEIFVWLNRSKTCNGRNLMPIANRMKPKKGGKGRSCTGLDIEGGVEGWGRGHFRSRDNTGPASLPLCSLLIFDSSDPLFLSLSFPFNLPLRSSLSASSSYSSSSFWLTQTVTNRSGTSETDGGERIFTSYSRRHGIFNLHDDVHFSFIVNASSTPISR